MKEKHPRFDSRPCVCCHQPVGTGTTLENADFHFAPMCGDCALKLGLLDRTDIHQVPSETPAEMETLNA